MAPRAYWKGYLRLSLVSCPIQLFPATSEREKVSFNQINQRTGNRIKYQKVDADTGDEVDAKDIVKGYEIDKGEYVQITGEDLEAVDVESSRTVEIEQFVPREEIDELYNVRPYYVVPDGEAGQQAFAVIREAIRKEEVVALARIVFSTREHVIALEPRGKGMLGIVLRYPYEVRDEKDFFDYIDDEKIPKDMLDLATHIVKSKSGHFAPDKFDDRYEDALKALIKEKASGREVKPTKHEKPKPVGDLMAALKSSLDGRASAPRHATRTQGRRAAGSSRTAKKATRSTARHKKTG